MEEIKKKQAISLSEVKEILGKVDVEEMDQIPGTISHRGL